MEYKNANYQESISESAVIEDCSKNTESKDDDDDDVESCNKDPRLY